METLNHKTEASLNLTLEVFYLEQALKPTPHNTDTIFCVALNLFYKLSYIFIHTTIAIICLHQFI